MNKNNRELKKLTLCRHCAYQDRCDVWIDFVNGEERDELERRGFKVAIVIIECPELIKKAEILGKAF